MSVPQDMQKRLYKAEIECTNLLDNFANRFASGARHHKSHYMWEKLRKKLELERKKIPDDNVTEKHVTTLESAVAILKLMQRIDHDDHIIEVLKGGHIRLNDGGKLFDISKSSGLIDYERDDSHYNDKNWVKKEAGSLRAGGIFKEGLIGKATDEKGNTITYFQLERHSAKICLDLYEIKELLLHVLWDFIWHWITTMNVGPEGLSSHTEKNNPIILGDDPFLQSKGPSKTIDR